jgi:hypothetical protein
LGILTALAVGSLRCDRNGPRLGERKGEPPEHR